jgi:hypothetical protein
VGPLSPQWTVPRIEKVVPPCRASHGGRSNLKAGPSRLRNAEPTYGLRSSCPCELSVKLGPNLRMILDCRQGK